MMLTINDISIACMGKDTFDRGQLIYKVKNVKSLKTEANEVAGRINMRATIVGNNVADYNVFISVDELRGIIIDSQCNCFAHNGYSGLCKHCVATLLEYMDRRDGKSVGTELITKPTQSGFEQIIEKFSMTKRVTYMQPMINGEVRLVPELFLENGEIGVCFRIGIETMYVVKNLNLLAEEVKNIEQVSYGKKLEFYNTMSAYEDKSKRILRFIMAQVEDSMYQTNIYGGRIVRKSIILDRKNIDDFLNLLMGETVDFDRGLYGKERIKIVEDVPGIVLKIIGEKDGITLHPRQEKIWYGRDYGYLLTDNVLYRITKEHCEQMEEFIRYGNSFIKTGIFVSKREVPAFVRDVLPELKKIYTIEEENFSEVEYTGRKAAFKIYLDAPDKNIITCSTLAFYDEYPSGVNIFNPELSKDDRDITTEIMVSSKIYSMFNAFDPEEKRPVLSDDNEKIYYLLTKGIDELRRLGEVYVSDDIKRMNVRSIPQVQLGISLKGDFLELDFSGTELSMDQLAEILSKYDRRKKYYRLKSGDFINLDNEEFAHLAEMTDKLMLGEKELSSGKVKLPKYRALYVEESIGEFESIHYDYNVEFENFIKNFTEMDREKIQIPEGMKAILREYQVQGFQWLKMLKDNGFGGILADDMGLGKTLQVITLLSACKKEKDTDEKVKLYPSLIVCPASLIYNWKSEIERFAPELDAVIISGNVETRAEQIRNIEGGQVAITSYDLLKRDSVLYEELYFECEIVDEAQYIKNHNTHVSKAVKQIKAGFKAALTGTPVENRLSELWSIFDYIMPGFLYTYGKFREKIEAPVVANGDKDALADLQRLIEPFILRRLKKDVLKFLPDKIEKNMYAKMEGEQWDLYSAHVQRMKMMLNSQSEGEFKKTKIQMLSELTKLRQLCCNPALLYENYGGESGKTKMCLELIKNAIDGGHKVLLFSQFTTMIDIIQEEMEKENIEFLTLTGATSKEKRQELVERFNNGEIPVFCISLKAGGTGLNLTAADIVIHYDPWWNVAVQNQATDRAHRIGQKKIVTVYKLIAKDSIEEGIIELQDKKKALADEILGSENISSSELTKDQLLELLR